MLSLFVLVFSLVPQEAKAQIGVPVCPLNSSVNTILNEINQDSISKWMCVGQHIVYTL